MIYAIIAIFILLPIAEIALLIKVAEVIHLGPTLLLIVATAVIGVYLLRREGINSLLRMHNSLQEGRLPVEGMVDVVALGLAGALLLTPGLITDSIGFALLIPPIRYWLARMFLNRAMIMTGPPGPDDRAFEEGEIIEGEIIEPGHHDHDNDECPSPRNRKDSPWRR